MSLSAKDQRQSTQKSKSTHRRYALSVVSATPLLALSSTELFPSDSSIKPHDSGELASISLSISSVVSSGVVGESLRASCRPGQDAIDVATESRILRSDGDLNRDHSYMFDLTWKKAADNGTTKSND